MSNAIIIGGTKGIGLVLAEIMATRGDKVTIAGRDPERSAAAARKIGPNVTGIAVDLTRPHDIAKSLADAGPVQYVVLAGVHRDMNTVREYDIDKAIGLVTLKLVGYTACIKALLPKMTENASIVLYGGLAKDRAYPGSTTVTSINGAVSTMVNTLALELAPIRVNALHPGMVGDSAAWAGKQEMLDRFIARTPTKKLATMKDVATATLFLLENGSVNGVNLNVDNGFLLT
jgi:NAD(P)-dependent dehydrogenase (short-subunit alcohol dehydrogenase family)